MQKRWNILSADETEIAALHKALRVNPVICKLLVQRGYKTFEQSKAFFRPSLEDLHSPWLMKDMHKAVERVIAAHHSNEKILVFGDYDVDGTTAVASMYGFLRKFHHALEFYIPHRYREGYGVSRPGIDFAHANGYTLIIALDCGIKSVDLITYAKELGIDFIVCDHHLPDEKLPPAIAILNAKQSDCNYPFKELCGCGVGFKLMQALTEKLGLPADTPFEFLDLVTTAIAADIVPIIGENRVLAYMGLKKVNENPNPGIAALIKLSALKSEIDISNLVFMIAPRVNAAGRMDDARKAVELFLATNAEDAQRFAEMLHSDNSDRKEADRSITEEALALVKNNPEWQNRKSSVLFQPHWHKGVVGIVASRVIETYFRPTIILTQSGEFAAGSARSVPGFNLYEAIHACRHHLLGYGGHTAAAGMTLELKNIDAFREEFENIVAATITPEQLIPELLIDAEVQLRDIRQSFYDIINQMEPFGPANRKPTFIARRVRNSGYSKILKEEHIRFSVKKDDIVVTGIGFRMADKFPLLASGNDVDIAFTLEINEWEGRVSIQLQVCDLRSSD